MRRIPGTVLVLALAFFCLGPILWVVWASLRPEQDILRLPGRLWAGPFIADHYRSVLSDPRVHRYLGNSVLVAVGSSLLATLLGAMAAFGIGRYRFRGRSFLLGLVLTIHLLPSLVSMGALYRLVSSLDLLNSLAGLVLVKGAGLSLAVWLLKGYFESLPREYEEMARVEGAGSLRIFFGIVLPLRIKGVLVAWLFLFAQSWKSFFLPLLLITDVRKMPLPLGLFQYAGEHGFEVGRICALSVVSLLPILLLLGALNRMGWQSLRPSG
ncbi:MAG: carbohydrate ABC transporter permease [bacterium]